MESKEIVYNLAVSNGIMVAEMVKVKNEDAENVDSIRHICRGGLSFLNRVHLETVQPMGMMGNKFVKFESDLWNCPFCGKTYYTYNKVDLNELNINY